MGGHIWGDAGNVEVRLRGTLHRRTVNAENILPVVMPVRCQEHLFEDTQAARHSKSRVFEDKYSTGKKKSTNFSRFEGGTLKVASKCLLINTH